MIKNELSVLTFNDNIVSAAFICLKWEFRPPTFALSSGGTRIQIFYLSMSTVEIIQYKKKSSQKKCITCKMFFIK